MKLSALLLCALISRAALSIIFDKVPLNTPAVAPRKLVVHPRDRKLEQNLTSSYLLGGAPDAMNTSHLQMLTNQQKGMNNFKQIGIWLNDLDERLNDLKDNMSRRVSDMAIGMQRRNMLVAHYNYMGEAAGSTLGNMGGMNPMSSG